jgi:hypothetical protein
MKRLPILLALAMTMLSLCAPPVSMAGDASPQKACEVRRKYNELSLAYMDRLQELQRMQGRQAEEELNSARYGRRGSNLAGVNTLVIQAEEKAQQAQREYERYDAEVKRTYGKLPHCEGMPDPK